MDFSAGCSSSSTSKVFYSQPSASQSKAYESSQCGLGNNSISLPVNSNNFTTIPDSEIIVLSSSNFEEKPELNSGDNKQVVFNKDEGKERDNSIELDFGTITSAGNDTVQLNEPELFDTSESPVVYDESKGKEREHSTESITVSSVGLNPAQLDDDEPVDMDIDYDIPQHTTIVSNKSISWAIDNESEPMVNKISGEQQLIEPSFVEKVIRFFNLYDYTFDIFDIVIEFSIKYQEIFQEDGVHMKPYNNNPCVLLELLSNFLSNRLNSANIHGTNFINLEMLAGEYYERLRNAESERQGLYRTSFRNSNFHSSATSLNEEKRSVIINSRVNNKPPAAQEKKKKAHKKAKKNKSSNGPRLDLEKILGSTIQPPQKEVETKVLPLSITEHLNKVVFNQGGFINSIIQSTSNFGNFDLSALPQGSSQTFNSPAFSTLDANLPTFYGTSTAQTIASTSSDAGKHIVEVSGSGSQQANVTNPYEINPNPLSNNEMTEYNISKYVPREEWPIPDRSFELGKEYQSMMADAIQKLAITNLAMKHNPESGPGELDSIVNKFKIKKIAKNSGTAHAYNETLINIFNHGGINMVMERLEGNISSHLKVKPKENKKQRKRRRLLQKQTKGEVLVEK